jgi:serine/threonine-protein kinase
MTQGPTDELANAATVMESTDAEGVARTTNAAAAPPERVAHYKITERIGAGGMGEVWCAFDERLERDVAIKVLHSGRRDANSVARFLREARVQGRLEHPSIVPVHDVGDSDELPYFVMKRLSGTTLEHVRVALMRGDQDAIKRWPRRTLLARLVDVCLAVELAHQRGVIHRDLKPANIILGEFGDVYVLDWGLARLEVGDDRVGPTAQAVETSAGKTVTGTLLGTPGYMAPEQMRGDSVDRRADIYALGCILFEILTGVVAVPRDSAFETTLAAPYHRPSASAPDADVPPELDDTCARATAADPSMRHATARELADEIQRFLDGDRDLIRRRELAAAHAARSLSAFADVTAPSVRTASVSSQRAEAMREAGRAIALDATNRDAQAVLARLLLEPPREVPPEAGQRIEDERQRNGREMLKIGALVYLSFGSVIPVLALLGVSGTWPLVVIAALLVVLATLCALAARSKRPLRLGVLTMYLALHCASNAFIGVVMGPLSVLPTLIVGSLTIMMVAPLVYAPKRLFAFHVLAFAVPISLEWLGVTPRTYSVESGALILHPWALHLSAASMLVGVISVMLVNMIGVTVISIRHRKEQELAQQRVHVQSWHLGQLVTERDAAAAS